MPTWPRSSGRCARAIPGKAVRQEFVLANRMPELDALVEGLAGFCAQAGLSEEVFGDIRLVLEEAVSNTIRHGYTDQNPHEIRVRASVEGDELILEIEDDGKAFNPLAAKPPDLDLPIEQKKPGGLGIFLIRELTERQEYRRDGAFNRLRVAKRIR